MYEVQSEINKEKVNANEFFCLDKFRQSKQL